MSRDSDIEILNFIDGELGSASSGATLDLFEPATGERVGRVAASDATDVDRAVAAAKRAFPGWSRTPAAERSRLLLRLADLIEGDFENLIEMESRDTGKSISLARKLDIPRAVLNFRFFATAILHEQAESHATDQAAVNYTLRQPLGVAGLISPWNLPLYLLSWKIAPAIATGNTCVAKPSELTPRTAMRLSELVAEAEIPRGVINIVHGRGPEAGAAISGHPEVPLISFTGGTATGEIVARTAAPMFKKLSLELGGKNPNVIFADADLDEAIAGTLRSSFWNQGEICLCGSRILVERSIFDEFMKRFVEETEKLVVGDPLDDATDVGALISREHLDKVLGYVELAREEGGEIVSGGKRPGSLPPRIANGWFLEPTIITGLGSECRTFQEEIFGPVVTVTPFDDEDEAVRLANDVRYGLSASVWTSNLGRAHRVAARIDSGTVWVNTWLLRDLRTAFGGMKASGVGREGGRWSLEFFTEPKTVCVKL
ncbi:MAG: aldehyde dehydrogenase [Acidobacteria bacterium]|nr:aldehyde dehydrogenase [Acidobacteriota bacterium]